MKNRPILIVAIGYIIGILWGLYFKTSIVLCYILITATYLVIKKLYTTKRSSQFKLLSFYRYSRYLKLIMNKKSIFILIIISIISNTIVLYQNQYYEKAYQDGQNIKETAIVISNTIRKTIL